MKYVACFLNAAILLYGGIADHKRKEIPDLVPILLILTGLFSGPFTLSAYGFRLLETMLGLFALTIVLLTCGDLPGGDCKLFLAMCFSVGLLWTGAALILCILSAIILGRLRGQKRNLHFPLCTYMAAAYLISAIFFLFSAGF